MFAIPSLAINHKPPSDPILLIIEAVLLVGVGIFLGIQLYRSLYGDGD